MCDYSLELVASRPARAGEKLVSTAFCNSSTRGFASVTDRSVAVCLLPGTELAFDNEIMCERRFVLGSRRNVGHKVARFRQINRHRVNTHHDALELPDGELVLLNQLCEGQKATVLQLPASSEVSDKVEHMRETLAD
jgi:hypothetical protein